MKKFFLAICVLVIVCVSCDGSSDEPSDNSGVVPEIDNVEMVQYKGYSYKHIDSVRNGEYINIYVYAYDPDLDIKTIVIKRYDMDMNIISDSVLELPTQNEPDILCYFINDVQILDTPLGYYKIGVKITDAAGNESEEFFIHVAVIE